MRGLKFRGWTGRCFVYFDVREDNDFNFYDFYSCCEPNDIEQYIGLKDKNGKEIYEGDITNDGNHICIIRWSEHFTEFEAVNEGEGYASGIWHVAKYGEVIGNIHENHELLGEEEE